MTTETAPQRPSPRWSARQTLLAVGVAAAIGGLGGAAIYAATAESPRTFAAGPRGMAAPIHQGPPPPAGQSPAAAQPAPNGVLHSEFVVSDGHGGFTTKLTQTGTVDEVTLSSVVVRSDDGYTQIYALPPGAATNSVQANDTVTVDATRTGPTVTLNRIGDEPARGN